MLSRMTCAARCGVGSALKGAAPPAGYIGTRRSATHIMGDSKKVLYLFDVDGTLTAPRQVIAPDTWRFLMERLSTRGSVGVVSGSDWAKVSEQLGGEASTALLPHVFCENGLVAYAHGRLQAARSLTDELGEELTQRIINFALCYMGKLTLPVKRGTFIEFRTGMINLCPVGRSCSQEQRDEFAAYDIQHGVRAAMADAMRAEFADCGLTIALGGQISVDVFPTGWDKTYCLRLLDSHHYDEIHFYGDKTSPGGNDYEIFSDPRTVGHTVTSPQHTVELLKQHAGIQ